MLLSLIKNLFSRRRISLRSSTAAFALEKPQALFRSGDFLSAIPAYRSHLKDFPHDVIAINDLGCCLANTGDETGAAALFEQAYSIDDSYLPVVVNYAKSLTDRQCTNEALPYLRQAKV